MKELILFGGYGTRLRPMIYFQQKQLIPIVNKPILFYSIEDVIGMGRGGIEGDAKTRGVLNNA